VFLFTWYHEGSAQLIRLYSQVTNNITNSAVSIPDANNYRHTLLLPGGKVFIGYSNAVADTSAYVYDPAGDSVVNAGVGRTGLWASCLLTDGRALLPPSPNTQGRLYNQANNTTTLTSNFQATAGAPYLRSSNLLPDGRAFCLAAYNNTPAQFYTLSNNSSADFDIVTGIAQTSPFSQACVLPDGRLAVLPLQYNRAKLVSFGRPALPPTLALSAVFNHTYGA
jgi:hypothetical protein